MRQLFTLLALIGLINCKETPRDEKTETEETKTEIEVVKRDYPDALVKVLEAHGGLENWRKQKTLTFEIPKPNAKEIHTIDLFSRRDKIEMPHVTMGFDGKEVWLLDENNAYEGNAAVYHNLMFYFYAMPFVLADDGINYAETEALEFEGKSYPGIHVGYDAGVGASPKDDYYLHYDPDTGQMAWLGYTFTYGSDKKSENVSYIRYGDWTEVDGVLLPKALTWYDNEGREIKKPKDPTPFENVSLSETAKPDSFYEMPKNAKVAAKK